MEADDYNICWRRYESTFNRRLTADLVKEINMCSSMFFEALKKFKNDIKSLKSSFFAEVCCRMLQALYDSET